MTVDLEDGFYAEPEGVAESIRRVAALGAVGASIEDKPRRAGGLQYEVARAAERIQAAAEAARALPHPFVLTARAENFFGGAQELEDTILRLQAYQAAGADVLYAPGLQTLEQIARVVGAVARPVNVLVGMQRSPLDFGSLARIGVRRISVGGALARLALSAVSTAVTQMLDAGRFDFAAGALSGQELNTLFATEADECPGTRVRSGHLSGRV